MTSPDQLCVHVSFEEYSRGDARITCLWYKSDRATPDLDDFLAATPVGTCGLTDEAGCTVVFGEGLRQASTYYIFCSGYVETSVGGSPSFVYLDAKPQCTETTCGMAVRTDDQQRANQAHALFGSTSLVLSALVLTYILWGWIFQHYPCARFLHETGFAVIAGLLAGYVLNWLQGPVVFEYSLFQYYILPVVIFGAGFNLEKQSFFRYASYIMALGVTGTVLVFILIFNGPHLISMETKSGAALVLTPHQRLVMASVLAGTDSVAPIAFLPSELFPSLFAIVFGEGVLNDVVSILLSEATAVQSVDEMPAVSSILREIAVLLAKSLGVGLTFGLGTSLVFKYLKPLREASCWLKPTSVMLIMNYLCYLVADICEFSSIFSLFVCSLLCGHYAVFSMSKNARHFAEELAEMMGYLAEAFVFGYFGVTAVFFINTDRFSLKLIGIYIVCIVVSRALAVLVIQEVMGFIKATIFGHRLKITSSELSIIGLAGCMRGTIAYALILKNVPRQDLQSESQELMVSTVLGIVVVNCLVFGGIFPVALRMAGLTPKALLPTDETQRPGFPDSASSEPRPRIGTEEISTADVFKCGSSQLHDYLGDAWHNFDERCLIPIFRPAPAEQDEPEGYRVLMA